MTASDWSPDSPATVDRDAAETGSSFAAAARTPVPEGVEERDGRTALRDALPRDLNPRAFQPVDDPQSQLALHRLFTRVEAENYADNAVAAGWRRVVVDDDTVEAVAAALWHSDVLRFADLPPIDWEKVKGHERRDYLRSARAAVQALRGDQQ